MVAAWQNYLEECHLIFDANTRSSKSKFNLQQDGRTFLLIYVNRVVACVGGVEALQV